MDRDLPDFLSDAPQAAPDAPQTPETVAQAPAPQPEAPATPPAADPAPPAPAAAEPATATPSDAQQAAAMNVPLATFLDMRDRANRSEQEARNLREWRQQQEAAARRQPPPSLEEDPQGFHQHQQQQFNAAIYEQRLTFSRSLNELKHGADTVNAAFEWGAARCDQDPFFNEKVRASADPIGFVVNEWRRDQVASTVDPSELEAFRAWKAAQAGQPPANPQNPAAAAHAPPAPPAAPRPSIAAAPSAGLVQQPAPRGGEETFARMFGS